MARGLEAPGDARQKLAGVEVVRFISSLGIVFFHVGAPGARLGYGGLLFFVAIGVAFASDSRQPKRPAAVIKARAKRLLVPWIFWSGVYGVAKLVKLHGFQNSDRTGFAWGMLFTGTSDHLWYLPFAFVVTTLFALVGPLGEQRARRLGWVALGGALIPLASLGMRVAWQWPPIPQWLFAAPAVCWGRALAGMRNHPQARPWTVAVIATGAACGCLVAARIRAYGMIVPTAAAIVLMWVAMSKWRVSGVGARVAIALGGLSYGVYLVHPLCDSFVRRAMGHSHRLGEAVVVACMSTAVAWVIKRSRLNGFVSRRPGG